MHKKFLLCGCAALALAVGFVIGQFADSIKIFWA